MEFKITITEEDIKKYPNNHELGTYIRKTYNQFLDFKSKDVKRKTTLEPHLKNGEFN
jgi:hypothetical protein